MRKIKLVIPRLTHPSLNSWMHAHWAVKDNYKQEWDFEIMTALRESYGRAVLVSLIKKANIKIRYYFKTKRSRDRDNFTPKFINDGLKGRVIKDDRDDWVKVDWEILVDKKKPRTTIEIKEIE